MKWNVIVDVKPHYIEGTEGCHRYVFGTYKTKKQADEICNGINSLKSLGKASVKKEDKHV